MKELWRRSTVLLWANPVVWIPVLCADLVAFAVKVGNGTLDHRIVHSLVQAQHASVLSQSSDSAAIHVGSAVEAALLVTVSNLGTQFVTMCLYATAALITWSLVQTLAGYPEPKWGAMILAKGWRILNLVLLALGVLLCSLFPAILLGLAIPLLQLARDDMVSLTEIVQFGALLVGYVAAAYWVTPKAVALMHPDGGECVAEETSTAARLFAVIAVVASLAIAHFCQTAERSIPGLKLPVHAWAGTVTGAGASLLSAFPYVVLFIFLSLAAENGPENVSNNGTPVIGGSAAALLEKYGDSSLRPE